MIGIAISIDIAVDGETTSGVLPNARITDGLIERITDDNQTRITDGI